MSSSQPQILSITPRNTAWANRPTTDFTGATGEVAILPIHGLGDHGLGLSSDIEEVIGSAVLAAAGTLVSDGSSLTILPPLRFGLSPYHFAIGRIDPDVLLSTLTEIAQSVARSGYRKLLFWTTNPWSSELVDTASRDIRIELGLQTFIIELEGVGLSLHPASPDRAEARGLGAHLTGRTPENVDSITPSGPTDESFRPGNWQNLPPITGTTKNSGPEILVQTAERLSGLLDEIVAHTSPGQPIPSANPERHSTREVTFDDPSYPRQRRERYLPALSAREMRELGDKSKCLVIIPVAAIEQHGAHLPVGVDALIAEAAADGLAGRIPEKVWFGPTLCFGKSNEHDEFPGTVSLGAANFRQLIKATVQSLHEAGFRQFAILNTHGGNSSVLTYTIRELQTELKIRAGMLRLKSNGELSEQESTWGFHAGEWETSVMLSIAPELVDMTKAVCHFPARLDDPGKLRPENAPAIFSWKTRDIAPAGVMGDATRGSAENGARWFKAALDQLATQIRNLI